MSTENIPSQAVTFDEAQQARVNELIREKQGEAAKTIRAELATTQASMAQLQADLTAAKEALAAAKPEEKVTNKEEVETLRAQLAQARVTTEAEIQRLKDQANERGREALAAKTETVTYRKQNAIKDAAAKVGFVDVGAVGKLTSENIKFDEAKGKFIVVDDGGSERLNAAFEPMTLEEYYSEYGAKNPYMVRSDARSGTGSTESRGTTSDGKFDVAQIFGQKSIAALANNLAKTNMKEYQRLKVIAKQSGLIT